jgi:hypothetical protein
MIDAQQVQHCGMQIMRADDARLRRIPHLIRAAIGEAALHTAACHPHGGDPAIEVVAGGTAWQGGVNPQQWTATIYPGPKNNFVFNAATIWWAQGLSKPPGHMPVWSHYSRPHGPDARVQQITENLLRRAIGA